MNCEIIRAFLKILKLSHSASEDEHEGHIIERCGLLLAVLMNYLQCTFQNYVLCGE